MSTLILLSLTFTQALPTLQVMCEKRCSNCRLTTTVIEGPSTKTESTKIYVKNTIANEVSQREVTQEKVVIIKGCKKERGRRTSPGYDKCVSKLEFVAK